MQRVQQMERGKLVLLNQLLSPQYMKIYTLLSFTDLSFFGLLVCP